ncbi:unnamed protein product, partial [Adineta steineri]
IFDEHIELPCFASFTVLKDEAGCQWMVNYLSTFASVAQKYNVGLILETATWRAHPECLRKLAYSEEDAVNVNHKSVELLCGIRDIYETEQCPIVISASVGPRGDGYTPSATMSPEQAKNYHATQIGVLSQTKTDMIAGLTLNYPQEAIGIVQAAKEVDMPITISFTVEKDGKLPTGQSLKETIYLVDKATDNAPLYYMVDCAHPSNIVHTFLADEDWVERIHGIKGNASKKSHAELDECTELDSGDPLEFGADNQELLCKMKHLNIFGRCCGTNYRHVEEICKSCIPVFHQLEHNKRRYTV